MLNCAFVAEVSDVGSNVCCRQEFMAGMCFVSSGVL